MLAAKSLCSLSRGCVCGELRFCPLFAVKQKFGDKDLDDESESSSSETEDEDARVSECINIGN